MGHAVEKRRHEAAAQPIVQFKDVVTGGSGGLGPCRQIIPARSRQPLYSPETPAPTIATSSLEAVL